MTNLLVEQMDFEEISVNLLTETIGDKVIKRCYVKGPCLVSEIKNGNGRVYPKPIIEREVRRMNDTKIKNCNFFGEMNHPDTIEINPERISHITKELIMDSNIAIGKSLILDTPLGKIAQSIFEGGGKLGISSRGVGTLKESIVQNDFMLHALDIVVDPSGPNCFLETICENKEWVFENGILTEKERTDIIKEVDKVIVEHQFSVEDRQSAFLKLFTDVISNIKTKHI